MAKDPKTYTAVLYFHGIGNPRRHVSLAQFLDYFDRFGEDQSKSEIGKPRDFRYSYEVFDRNDLVNFVEFKRVVTVKGHPLVSKTIRVYEGYWAPEAGNRSGLFFLLAWLLKRIFNPFKVLASRWRAFPGLRLSHLHRQIGETISRSKAQRIERAYRDFENWESRESYKRGSYNEFFDYVTKISPRYVNSIQYWWKGFFWYNVKLNAYVTIILLCSLCFSWILTRSIYESTKMILYADTSGSPVAVWTNISSSILGLGLILYMYFKSDAYVFDVVSWTADSERGEGFQTRDRIIRYSQRLLRHVLSDPNCAECIIIGHSLGTSIASEALLREGQLARASTVDPKGAGISGLEKVKHVFTVGSPIDRIFYLFQTDSSFSHRYSRLFEEQRLSIELPPFTIPARPSGARLINFWSRFDPISSVLTSLRKNASDREDAIINIESLPPRAPLPIGSHTSYFSDRSVMKPIYWTVMTGRLPRNQPMTDQRKILPAHFGRLSVVISFILATITLGSVAYSIMPEMMFGVTLLWLLIVAGQRWLAVRQHVRQHGKYIQR